MEFELRHIHVPFRFQYGHSLKQHHGLDAVICLARDSTGKVGFGEAVPRTYVTGETCQSIFADAPSLIEQLQLGNEQSSFNELRLNRSTLSQQWAGPFPSCALSAIDLAYCDLLAKRKKQPLVEWMGSDCHVAKGYCASIGFGKGWKGKLKLRALLLLYQRLGFRRFKVKVGNDQDQSRLQYIRNRLGFGVEIFADANAAWDKETAIKKIEMLTHFKIWAIEEPLHFREAQAVSLGKQIDRLATLDDQHFADYQWLRQRSPIPLIADESLICISSLQRIIDSKSFDILNMRLSKCGGPLASANILDIANQNGLQFSIAAMVGESPILATAGAHFGAYASDIGMGPRYIQGYSHGLLHKTSFAKGEPKLKNANVRINHRADSGNHAGLGLTIDPQQLDSITKNRCLIKI